MDDQFKIVCGTCKREPGLMSDAHGEVAICFGCGQRDSADEAFRISAEHNAIRIAGAEHTPLMEQSFRWQSASI